MKLNYFDFGVCFGRELGIMKEIILPSLKIENYQLFGFEPCKSCFDDLEKKYKNDNKVFIIDVAISDSNKNKKLYYSYKRNKYTPIGNSLFPTKYNVKKNKYEEVKCELFSKWLLANVPDYTKSYNIIRSNMEGSEWFLFNDLNNMNLLKDINLFCGVEPEEDMKKIKELQPHIHKLNKILKKNRIIVHPFIDMPDVDNIKKEIRREYE